VHGSSKPPQSPTGQENDHSSRDESELDDEEQQEKENDNANIPDDCINIECNEVNGRL
jgi:hypothetical protein